MSGTRLEIFHNPRCSKSRAALAMVEAAGIDHAVVRYLETPPDAARLKAILKALGMAPRDAMRTKEKAYRDLGLDDPALDEAALIAAMVANPILIERPILVYGDRACLARPPELAEDFIVETGLGSGQAPR